MGDELSLSNKRRDTKRTIKCENQGIEYEIIIFQFPIIILLKT